MRHRAYAPSSKFKQVYETYRFLLSDFTLSFTQLRNRCLLCGDRNDPLAQAIQTTRPQTAAQLFGQASHAVCTVGRCRRQHSTITRKGEADVPRARLSMRHSRSNSAARHATIFGPVVPHSTNRSPATPVRQFTFSPSASIIRVGRNSDGAGNSHTATCFHSSSQKHSHPSAFNRWELGARVPSCQPSSTRCACRSVAAR
jgi:hypothetical protein